jgi:hypothetical protein
MKMPPGSQIGHSKRSNCRPHLSPFIPQNFGIMSSANNCAGRASRHGGMRAVLLLPTGVLGVTRPTTSFVNDITQQHLDRFSAHGLLKSGWILEVPTYSNLCGGGISTSSPYHGPEALSSSWSAAVQPTPSASHCRSTRSNQVKPDQTGGRTCQIVGNFQRLKCRQLPRVRSNMGEGWSGVRPSRAQQHDQSERPSRGQAARVFGRCCARDGRTPAKLRISPSSNHAQLPLAGKTQLACRS